MQMVGKGTCKYIFFLCLVTNFKTHGYQNYTLYQVTAFSTVERYMMVTMEKFLKYTSFLNGITNEAALPIQVSVDDCCIDAFIDLIRQFSVSYVKTAHFSYVYQPPRRFSITDSFMDWNSMDSWFLLMEKKYPQLLTRIVIGLTYEKREILVFKVSKKQNNAAVFILGGEEGRDWLSPAIILNLMEKFMVLSQSLLPYDFYFLPLLNPDGYEFSRIKERLWTKNRREYTPKLLCPDNTLVVGANIDRNWFEGTGGLRDCTPIYEGTKPISEEETVTLSLFLDTIAPQTMAFFNLRGFDRVITTPYATKKKIAFNYDTTMEIFNYAAESLRRKYNVTYMYGSTASLFFNKSGNCADWVKENINVPMVASIYLKYGNEVMPEPSHIVPVFQHFEVLLSNILHLTGDLYGPLFNSQNHQSRYTLYLPTTLLLCLFNINIKLFGFSLH